MCAFTLKLSIIFILFYSTVFTRFTPFHFEWYSLYDFANKVQKFVYTHSLEKRRKKSKQCVWMPYTSRKISWHCQQERLETTTQISDRRIEMKWNEEKSKQTKVRIYINGNRANFVHLFPILSKRIDSCHIYTHIQAGQCTYSCHCDHCSRCIYHIPLSLWEQPLHISRVSAPQYWFISIYRLLLICSAWNNRIIRSKCLLSQISSLKQ